MKSRGEDAPLSKKFFHKFEQCEGYPDPGILKCQGQIQKEVTEGLYLVRYFSFLDGFPTNEELVKIEDMADWFFYDSAEEMRHSVDYGVARRHQWRDEE